MAVSFGKYLLLDKIATGGMAEIWLAKQVGVEGFEKLVVIKKILPHFTNDKDFVRMFLDEARLAAQLNHPNIVQIYDLGQEEESYYIAMEYISGDDIKNILQTSIKQGHFLPLQFAVNIISQGAEGLHYAHTLTDMYGTPMNVVHRDISPQNILVTYAGTVKVVDFGIAKAATQSQETQAGTLKGKFAYMSPEQAMGRKLDGRSDVFALGIVLYEITVGKRLFKAPSELKILRMITEERIIPPIEINPKYPPALSNIVMKALEKDRDKRYQDAREFHLDLDDFLKTFPKPSSNIDLSNWMRKTFAELIEATKVKHETLLREEADSFVNADIGATAGVTQENNLSQVTPFGQQGGTNPFGGTTAGPLGFTNTPNTNTHNNTQAGNTNIYQQGFGSATSVTGSFSGDGDKNKILMISVVMLLLVIAGLLALFLIMRDKEEECDPGYAGKSCKMCAPGYQDNDNDGRCLPTCNFIKLRCPEGQVCTDSTGFAKCFGEKKVVCPVGHTGSDCSICVDGFEKIKGICQKKVDKQLMLGTVIVIPISTKPSYADIIINGQLYKDKSNTEIPLKIGDQYEIKIEKRGYLTTTKKFTFKNPKEVDLSFDRLTIDKTKTFNSTLIIRKNPTNMTLLLDGEQYPEDATNPMMILRQLAPGKHLLEAKAEGYESYKKVINLSNNTMPQKKVHLKKKNYFKKVTITSFPDKSAIYLNNRRIGYTPLIDYKLPLKSRYKLTFSKRGYQRETITFSSKNVKKSISVDLTPVGNTRKPAKTKKTPKKTPKVVKKSDVEEEKGFLTINTVPYTNIIFKGKNLGTTPLNKVKIPVGRHTIQLINKDQMINDTIVIRIQKDETLKQIFPFKKGTLRIDTPGVSVTANGKVIGTSPLRKALYQGNYSLMLKGAQGTKRKKIKIRARQTINVSY